MKALTVSQPFAWLIANGHKRIENRRWATRYRGPLMIHAGRGDQYRADYDDIRALCPEIPIPHWDEVKKGAVVALADLMDCVPAERGRAIDPEWAEGPCCWVLARVLPLDRPIVIPGAQGLWTPTTQLLARVMDELAAKEVFLGR